MHTVLIADDERMVRMNLRTLIERDSGGFRVVGEAKDGEQALQECLEHEPDLIITDIRMPGIEGLELIRRLSERNLDAEFLVVSGYSDFQYAQKALRFGVADYLLKPIDPDYFHSVLDKVSARIRSKSEKRKTSRDWVWTWKVRAEHMAKALWSLNEVQMNSELDWLRSMIPEGDKPVQHEMADRFDYYLIVLEAALEEMNGTSLPMPKLKPLEESPTYFSLADSMESTLTRLSEHIRSSRNWWSYNRLMKKAWEYIEQHYSNSELTLKDTAEQFELSANYFGNLFKKESGMSFNQYLMQLRLDKAKVYLQDPMIKLYEIGEMVGFKDYAYFSRAFKKHTGISPSEFRKHESM